MKQVIHKSKKWLSNSTTSFVYAYLGREDGYLWGQFKLGDRSRIVNFDIEIANKRERRATIKKLRTIAEEASSMADAIKEMDDRHE